MMTNKNFDMERRITRLFVCSIAVLMAIGSSLCHTASAQDYVAPPVTISKDKIKRDGKEFYSHIVLEKQTLYSISKAYDVTIEEIYKYNPTVKEDGLRKNDILNIPVKEEAEPQKIRNNEKTRQPQVKTDHVEVTSEVRHVVKWFEDLASISKKYDVPEEAIIQANALKGRKLKKRQVLIIPDKDSLPESVEAPEESIDSVESVVTQELEESNGFEQVTDSVDMENMEILWTDKSVNATLILPFKASGTSSNRNNMDFYSGVLLAARELVDNGTKIHLNVYDIAQGHGSLPIDVLKASDVIIGPIAPNDITQVAGLTGGSCPIISPLDQRAERLTGQYQNLIQTPASQHSQFTDMALWLKEDMLAGDRIIVISEKGARQNDGGKVMKSVIDHHDLDYTPFSYSILEGRNIQPSLEAAMTKVGTNRVVIASESEAFVNDAVRNLNLIIHNKFNVVLYAPAKIRTFETIEVENFHNTSLHASLTYNIDYDDENVQTFIMRYRAMFGTEPTQFAFQGYDITRYFADLIAKYQDLWLFHLTEENANMLQNSFQFKQNGSGGYTNVGIRRIIYDKGYSIISAE